MNHIASSIEGSELSQTIFVLEDDADISRLVQYHLESAGFTVRPYLAISQILSDAERQPPALFLLDIMVPGGEGVLRAFERPSSPSVLKFENVEIDAGAMQLRVDGELVTTTATEFRLLDYLAPHPA